MDCCTTSKGKENANSFFSRYSRMYAKRFRKHGLERMQKLLLDGVRREPMTGKDVLDIGCGVGGLHLTLLKEGAGHATGVDMSDGMISTARKFSSELGLADRAEYIVGDFVEIGATIPECDVTLLDKVVCCYEDIDALVRTSTRRTKRIYAISHPKQNVFTELTFKTHIVLAKLFKWKFHPFWHDWDKLKEDVMKLGFEQVYSASTPMWQVLVFRRV